MPIKEPVDIFDSSGTNPPEQEEAEEQEDEQGEEEELENEDAEEEDEESDDEDSEDDEDEEGEDDDEEEDDPKQAEIDRLNGLLKTKNNSLREMRKSRRTSAVSSQEFKPPYPNLKRSHELPKDEQDEMTEREKKLYDDSIEIKERLNDDAKKAFEIEEKKKADEINEDALTDDEAEDFVKASAKYLAKGNTKMANQIIRKYNQFNNEGLTEEEIEDRLADASKLVKGFKKPKEQARGKKGKSVKKAKRGEGGIDEVVKNLDHSGAKKPVAL